MKKSYIRLETNIEVGMDEDITGLDGVQNIGMHDTKLYVSEDCINWRVIDFAEFSETLTQLANGILESGLEGIEELL